MPSHLNPVDTTITVAGQKIHFVGMSLIQKFNSHHHFRIEVDYEEFGGKWMDDPTKIIRFIGQDVNIMMQHKQTGENNFFSGLITNVSFSGYHGQQNCIILTGSSPTIKLEGKPTMDSFMDMTLQQIVDEAVGTSGNGCPVIAKPVFSSQLDFVCQYEENCFDFLNRLSWEYGEWFFYNGLECYFGKKQGEGISLEYDKEMTHFDLSANLVPGKFNRYHYLNHDDKEIDNDAPGSVPGERGYLTVSKGCSESVYTSTTNNPLGPSIKTKKDLDDLVKAEKSRAVGEMLIMRGNTQTCKVKIGGMVSVKLPAKMDVAVKSVDTFLVTEVTHTVDQKGHYSNSFEGIMSGIEVIPMAVPRIPHAGPQIATVKDNADDKGRVKVELQWQKKTGKTTNWVRVQTPDAGKSDLISQNRGFVFIPEKDDRVMVGFEYGNPDRPYIMGSIFSEKVSIGGGMDNNIKTIITRSGHTIKFDDTDGKEKIQIYDKKGNIIQIDTPANTINLFSNEIINMTSGTVNINASQNINATAGAMVNIAAGATTTVDSGINTFMGAGMNISMNAGKNIGAVAVKTLNMCSGSGASLALDAKGKGKLSATKNVDVTSQGKLNINSVKNATIKSKKTQVTGQSKMIVTGSKVEVK